MSRYSSTVADGGVCDICGLPLDGGPVFGECAGHDDEEENA